MTRILEKWINCVCDAVGPMGGTISCNTQQRLLGLRSLAKGFNIPFNTPISSIHTNAFYPAAAAANYNPIFNLKTHFRINSQ